MRSVPAKVAICPQKAKHATFNSFVVTLSCLRNHVRVRRRCIWTSLARNCGFSLAKLSKQSTLSMGCLKEIATSDAEGKPNSSESV